MLICSLIYKSPKTKWTTFSDRDKGSPEEKKNATAEALELALKYNFVTPLTSMVVTKPKNEENQEDKLIADKLTEGMIQIHVNLHFYCLGSCLMTKLVLSKVEQKHQVFIL